jgi:hypothetical protein
MLGELYDINTYNHFFLPLKNPDGFCADLIGCLVGVERGGEAALKKLSSLH